MLNNDVFIFDNAVHMYDLSDANIGRPDGYLDRAHHLKFAADRRPQDRRTPTAMEIPSPRLPVVGTRRTSGGSCSRTRPLTWRWRKPWCST